MRHPMIEVEFLRSTGAPAENKVCLQMTGARSEDSGSAQAEVTISALSEHQGGGSVSPSDDRGGVSTEDGSTCVEQGAPADDGSTVRK